MQNLKICNENHSKYQKNIAEFNIDIEQILAKHPKSNPHLDAALVFFEPVFALKWRSKAKGTVPFIAYGVLAGATFIALLSPAPG